MWFSAVELLEHRKGQGFEELTDVGDRRESNRDRFDHPSNAACRISTRRILSSLGPPTSASRGNTHASSDSEPFGKENARFVRNYFIPAGLLLVFSRLTPGVRDGTPANLQTLRPTWKAIKKSY
jgi:hypothetical protein